MKYINNINIVDINSLFDLLHDKESQYEQQLENQTLANANEIERQIPPRKMLHATNQTQNRT